METKFTRGEWKIHHWKKGVSGVIGYKKEGNISYFSGDAVNYPHFSIVSTISPKEHGVQHSFEGASIAEIYDCGEESKANAKLIAAAPEMYEALKQILDGCPPATEREAFMFVDIAKSIAKEALKKATE